MKSTIAYVRQMTWPTAAWTVGYTGNLRERHYGPQDVPATVLRFVNDPRNRCERLSATTSVFYRPANSPQKSARIH